MVKLTKKQRELLALAERQAPQTIEQLAKMANLPCLRVYNHVRQLEVMGLVRLEQSSLNDRQVVLVVPTDPCYLRLIHLDEMYRAWCRLSLANQAS